MEFVASTMERLTLKVCRRDANAFPMASLCLTCSEKNLRAFRSQIMETFGEVERKWQRTSLLGSRKFFSNYFCVCVYVDCYTL